MPRRINPFLFFPPRSSVQLFPLSNAQSTTNEQADKKYEPDRERGENKVTLNRKSYVKREGNHIHIRSMLHRYRLEIVDRSRGTMSSIARLERWREIVEGRKERRKEQVSFFFFFRRLSRWPINAGWELAPDSGEAGWRGKEWGVEMEIKEGWISVRRSNERNRGHTFGTVSAILDEINGTTKWEQKCRGRVEGSIKGAMRVQGWAIVKVNLFWTFLCVRVCVCFVGWFFSGCFELQRIFVWAFGYGIRIATGMRVGVVVCDSILCWVDGIGGLESRINRAYRGFSVSFSSLEMD